MGTKAFHEVRVCDEGLAEGNQVGIACIYFVST
jgi:hypothetical protein